MSERVTIEWSNGELGVQERACTIVLSELDMVKKAKDFLTDILAEVRLAKAAKPEPVCEWKPRIENGGHFHACGQPTGWTGINPEGITFCPFCGGRIRVVYA